MPTVYLSNPWKRKIKFIVSLETVENGNIEREPWMLVLRPLEPWDTFNTRSGTDENKTIQQTHELTEFIFPNHKDHEEQMVEYAEKAYETTNNNELCR